MESNNNPTNNPYMIPLAIVVAGLIVAGAMFYGPGEQKKSAVDDGSSAENSGLPTSPTAENVLPVGVGDHILGSPNAKVTVIEFSDFECPYCKNFHQTMHQIVDQYGKNGDVAWVYRQFPLASIHPKAPKESEASECAAELGGNDGFWAFSDRIFEVTPSNNGLDPEKLPEIAEDIGLDRKAFVECLASGRHSDKVEADLQDALNSGGRGTPFNIIVTASGGVFPFSGAIPLEQVKNLIDQALEF